jgi:hypothetical protein
MAKQVETKIIKETSYCKIYNRVSIEDDDYYSCIERIEVKSKNRDEIRFSLYKDTIRGDNRYIPRSLDVTEIQLLNLLKLAMEERVFSDEFIDMLKQELNKNKKS